MTEKVKINPRYFDLIGDVRGWYKNYLAEEKKYLETKEHKNQAEITQINMDQAAIKQIEERWVQASPDGEKFQLSQGQIYYLKDAVETGIVNRDICPLNRVQLQELLEYLESIAF